MKYKSILTISFYLFFNSIFLSAAIAIEKLKAHGGPVKGLTISNDQKLIASASFDYSAVLWGLNPTKDLVTLIGHDAAVNTLKFSPDNSILATGGDDNQLLLWNVKKSLLLEGEIEPIKLLGHKGKIVDLAFSKDGKKLFSASWDGTIGVWDVNEKRNIKFMKGHKGPVYSIQLNKDETKIFSSGADGKIIEWNSKKLEYVVPIVENGWGVSVFTVDEEKDFITFGSTDGIIKVQSIKGQKELLRIAEDRIPILSSFYLPKKNMLSYGNAKGRIILLNTLDWSLIRDFSAVNGPVWDNLILESDSSLFVAGLDDFITRWHIFDFPPQILEKPGPARRFHPNKEISNGERQFARKCSVCHTLRADGKKRAGPSLHKVFGREAGTLEGYVYSEALIKSKIVWNENSISKLFEDGPDKVTPGTKMPIQKMKNKKDRLDLVLFLKEATK
tara:strand:+ start:5465 stop:6799 length:1335 start_codon:yes stop_codon:yes gene_type:complete